MAQVVVVFSLLTALNWDSEDRIGCILRGCLSVSFFPDTSCKTNALISSLTYGEIRRHSYLEIGLPKWHHGFSWKLDVDMSLQKYYRSIIDVLCHVVIGWSRHILIVLNTSNLRGYHPSHAVFTITPSSSHLPQ